MRSRNRLLGGDHPPDPVWLAALEAQMAEHGVAMVAARSALVDAMATQLSERKETLFALPAVALVDHDGAAVLPGPAHALAEALGRNRIADARAGRALFGPHRHDLAVQHRDTGQPAARCSTGEQKALLLSLVLCHGDLVAAKRGQRPVLLLDELAAHLDPLRRAALFTRLAASGGQVWMTGTESALFDAMPDGALRLSVDQGVVVT
jgi:DNA replication and repair protein RecF